MYDENKKYFAWVEKDYKNLSNIKRYRMDIKDKGYVLMPHKGPFFSDWIGQCKIDIFVDLDTLLNINVISDSNKKRLKSAKPYTYIKLHKKSRTSTFGVVRLPNDYIRNLNRQKERVAKTTSKIQELKRQLEDNPIYSELQKEEKDYPKLKAELTKMINFLE